MEGPVERGFGLWYDRRQGDTGDLWHRTLIDPALFRLLGKLPRGSRVLDLGCGNGYIARRLASAGARVVGIDASSALVRAARCRERTAPLGVRYLEADAARIPGVPDESMDVVVANMSLMDIRDAGGAIAEVGRILRRGGRFVFSICHPCFDVDTRSGWEIVPRRGARETVFRKVTAYRRPHADVYRWELSEGVRATTVGYHRPLAWYLHHLRSAGLTVVDVEEPLPGPGFVSRRRARRAWIEEIPLHLVVEARRAPRGRAAARPTAAGSRRRRPPASDRGLLRRVPGRARRRSATPRVPPRTRGASVRHR
jgi:ubiquinone/menaquinone biosynthesis C-methylase UbiE